MAKKIINKKSTAADKMTVLLSWIPSATEEVTSQEVLLQEKGKSEVVLTVPAGEGELSVTVNKGKEYIATIRSIGQGNSSSVSDKLIFVAGDPCPMPARELIVLPARKVEDTGMPALPGDGVPKHTQAQGNCDIEADEEDYSLEEGLDALRNI